MSRVVLFHSVQGLRPGVEEWAGRLREAGHEVWTPDLLEGRTFDDLDSGVAHRDELGVPELMKRAEAALAELPADLVFAGFSMGAATAGYYAATRPGARGAVLMHGVPPLRAYGVEAWPEELPAQVHFADRRPLGRAGGDHRVRAADRRRRRTAGDPRLPRRRPSLRRPRQPRLRRRRGRVDAGPRARAARATRLSWRAPARRLREALRLRCGPGCRSACRDRPLRPVPASSRRSRGSAASRRRARSKAWRASPPLK